MLQSGLNVSSFLWLMLAASFAAIISRKLHAPYALGLVVTGFLIGLPHLLPSVRLDPHVLFTVFLPPLLFETAINLRANALKAEWRPVLLFSIAVTHISCLIIGYLAHLLLHLPLASALVFGALISATDPVSVIAVFRQLGASRRLTLLVDAEALFNDGIAVVLFTIFLASATGGPQATIVGGGVQFVVNVVGGVVVGVLVGFLASFATRQLDDHLLEITVTTIVAFGSYLAADTLHLSGVLSVITAGLVVGNYGMPTSMSPSTRLAVSSFWDYAAFVVNSIVFLIVGIEEAGAGLLHELPLVFGATLVVLAGRCAIYPVSYIANRLGSNIPRSFQHVLVWGGLRGALSMALALGLAVDFPERHRVVAATFGAVFCSLLIQGLTIKPLLTRLGLTQKNEAPEEESARLTAQQVAVEAALREIDSIETSDALPSWAVDAIRQEFTARAEALLIARSEVENSQNAGSDTPLSVSPTPTEYSRQLRRRVLLAERDALRQAQIDEHVDRKAAQGLIARIDAQLLALHAEAAH